MLVQAHTLIGILIVLAMGLHELKKPTTMAQELPTISENIYSIATAMESQVSAVNQLGSRSYPFCIWGLN
jgi:hypothetical protein